MPCNIKSLRREERSIIFLNRGRSHNSLKGDLILTNFNFPTDRHSCSILSYTHRQQNSTLFLLGEKMMKFWSKIILIFAVFMLNSCATAVKQPTVNPDTDNSFDIEAISKKAQTGDLILRMVSGADSIAIATASNSFFSHIGIVIVQDDNVYVWDCFPRGPINSAVNRQTIKQFLNGVLPYSPYEDKIQSVKTFFQKIGGSNTPIIIKEHVLNYALLRLKNISPGDKNLIIEKIKDYSFKKMVNFDREFALNNDGGDGSEKLYCAEFVYKIYENFIAGMNFTKASDAKRRVSEYVNLLNENSKGILDIYKMKGVGEMILGKAQEDSGQILHLRDNDDIIMPIDFMKNEKFAIIDSSANKSFNIYDKAGYKPAFEKYIASHEFKLPQKQVLPSIILKQLLFELFI